MIIAMDITTALWTSILAFFLGISIGISLGYVIWAEKDRQKTAKNRRKIVQDQADNNARLNSLEKRRKDEPE